MMLLVQSNQYQCDAMEPLLEQDTVGGQHFLTFYYTFDKNHKSQSESSIVAKIQCVAIYTLYTMKPIQGHESRIPT